MSKLLEFKINTNSPIPVYVQIENLVQFSIITGRILPGETLPSVRKLATELSANTNTVTKAYRDLELRGLVETIRGVGVMVANDAVSLCKEFIRQQSKSHLVDAVAECIASGFKAKEIQKMVNSVIQEKRLPYSSSEND